MTPSYRIRQLAENDLEQIWLYSFQECGSAQADRYIRLMIGQFAWLTENPLLGKRRDDVKPSYYSFPEGRHVIFLYHYRKRHRYYRHSSSAYGHH